MVKTDPDILKKCSPSYSRVVYYCKKKIFFFFFFKTSESDAMEM
jgi:hypothetical protein